MVTYYKKLLHRREARGRFPKVLVSLAWIFHSITEFVFGYSNIYQWKEAPSNQIATHYKLISTRRTESQKKKLIQQIKAGESYNNNKRVTRGEGVRQNLEKHKLQYRSCQINDFAWCKDRFQVQVSIFFLQPFFRTFKFAVFKMPLLPNLPKLSLTKSTINLSINYYMN